MNEFAKKVKINAPSFLIRHSGMAVSVIRKMFLVVFLTGICYVMLYPVLFILSGSFKSLNDVYDPTVIWLPKAFTLQPIQMALKILDYSASVVRTLKMMVPSVILEIICVLLTGYGFARFKFKERNILFGILIFSIIVPVQSYIIPLYVNFRNFDFFGIGSIFGLITGKKIMTSLLDTNTLFYLQAITGTGIRSGLYIFIVRQFFRNIPFEIEEAAMIDGCGPLKTFTKVMIPNTIPLIATISVFSSVWYWNDYFLSSIFFKSKFPVSVNLTFLNSLLSTSNLPGAITGQELFFMKETILTAGCLVTILPLILFYIIAQRFFIEGIERSGIVG